MTASTIREERNPNFWREIVDHPAVAALVGSYTTAQIAALLARPTVLPLASEHGGFLFSTLDPFARVVELHTLYAPAGWGREVHQAAKNAFEMVFERGVRLIVTHQMEANRHSRPPRSFGFAPCGEMSPGPIGGACTWALTYPAWLESPGRRTLCH